MGNRVRMALSGDRAAVPAVLFLLRNVYRSDIGSRAGIGDSIGMRQETIRKQRDTTRRHRSFLRRPNTLQLIRHLCMERARLQEEVRQLSAAVLIYKELADRSATSVAA